MDLSLLQNLFDLDTYFSKWRVWELQKEILTEKFWPLWTKIGFFSLLRFWSTKQATEEVFLAYQDQLKVFLPRRQDKNDLLNSAQFYMT